MTDRALERLSLVATAESVSFAILLVGSVLRRTTEIDIVPVLGPIHGVLYMIFVILAVPLRGRLGWSVRYLVLAATVLSPFAHFLVAAARRRSQVAQPA
jgi:integral membrane protein